MNAARILAFAGWVLAGCSIGAFAQDLTEPSIQELKKAYSRPASIPYPSENSFTQDRAELGKMLFFDPRLSGSQVMSCATCHNPSFSWGDRQEKAVGHGHKILGRRTPTILNLAWAEKLFWDGRAGSLEDQALGPMLSEGEMAGTPLNISKTVSAQPEYRERFAKAYPGEKITEKTVAKAIATYERGVVSGRAPFDRWLEGDEKAISEGARRGFRIFNGKARCGECHSGWSFTDHSFQDIGLADDDAGRGKLVPLAKMQHAFKTPTLRNVALRAPYMHNGSEKTLEDVVEFYNRGGKAKRPRSVSRNIHPLHLSAGEKTDLIEFLNSLTSVDKSVELPVLPNQPLASK